jgi:predicted  nucleic acid-binding Zn-ribbon protein
LCIVFAAILSISAGAAHMSAARGAGAPQDVINLDRRINSLEQRLYSIESSIRGLEQQATLSRGAPATGQRDMQFELLQRQIATLSGQINEIKCGLARLDERTLPAGKRSQGVEDRQRPDPCRLNPDLPLSLSGHP